MIHILRNVCSQLLVHVVKRLHARVTRDKRGEGLQVSGAIELEHAVPHVVKLDGGEAFHLHAAVLVRGRVHLGEHDGRIHFELFRELVPEARGNFC